MAYKYWLGGFQTIQLHGKVISLVNECAIYCSEQVYLSTKNWVTTHTSPVHDNWGHYILEEHSTGPPFLLRLCEALLCVSLGEWFIL